MPEALADRCENDARPISLRQYNVFLDAGPLQPGSLFAASVTDFDHALPIWHPLAHLPLNPLRTHWKFAGFDPHATTFPGAACYYRSLGVGL